MTYFKQIRKTLKSQDLIDIYHMFETGQDTTAIIDQHKESLSDTTYKTSDKCDLIERCLIRFDNFEILPKAIEIRQQIAERDRLDASTNLAVDAMKHRISMQHDQIYELEHRVNGLLIEIDNINEQNNAMHNYSHIGSGGIIQGAESRLSSPVRWLAEYFLAQEIQNKVLEKFTK
jgi:hypothetical protein